MLTHCPDLHSDPISLVMQCLTKWKIQFLPICYEQEAFLNQPNFGQRMHHHHPPPCMLYSVKVRKRGSVTLQVLGSCTTHVKAQWVTCQRYNPMLTYMMGQSQISNMGAGNGTWCLPRRLNSQEEVVSMMLGDMGGRLSRRNIPSFFTYLFTLNFPIL